jgi:hypothetical protein
MSRNCGCIAASVTRAARSVVLLFLASFFISRCCMAIPAAGWSGEPVPLERLFQNVDRYVEQRPTDAQGHYTLGRLHSLAFTRGMVQVRMYLKDFRTGEPLPLPDFAAPETILQPRTASREKPDASALRHLIQSVRHYQIATGLSPKKSLYWLGLGWMLEHGAPFALQVNEALFEIPPRASAEYWRQKALFAYRRAYALDIARDLKAEGLLAMSADYCISCEAGDGVLRLLRCRKLTAAEKKEGASIERSLKTLEDKPHWMSPIIFPLDGTASLEAMLAGDRVASFDMAGSGRKHFWPWVGPNTGILVWDPEKTGRILSGRQLFGSATWSMFWGDGYQPLAALDNNQDGWLEGKELEGLAVWCDANGNGVSDLGEVRPISEIAIARVAAQAAGRSNGTLYNPRGLQRLDGTFVPTYDWTPVAVAEPTPRGRRERQK